MAIAFPYFELWLSAVSSLYEPEDGLGVPSLAKLYLPSVIVTLFSSVWSALVYTSPTGIHTNWLPLVSLVFPGADTSSIIIPFVTSSSGFTTLKPAGTVIEFPNLSCVIVFSVSFPVISYC